MHTLIIIGLGLALLAGMLMIVRTAGGSPAAVSTTLLAFVPLWLWGAGVNLAFGVLRAGYSLGDEVPVFLVVFAVPAAAALGMRWRVSRATRQR